MTLSRHLPYSPPVMNGWRHIGAFVVQFRADADIATGWFEGRVEHVASGRTAHFHSMYELLAFLNQVLREVRNQAAGDSAWDVSPSKSNYKKIRRRNETEFFKQHQG